MSVLKKILPLRMSSEETSKEEGLAVAEKEELQKPSMYKVMMLNDDYTTMEFVIHVLMKFFSKSYDEAHALMLKVHHDGQAICGIYTFEIAESKSQKVNKYARSKGHPLKCMIEACES